LSHGETLFGLYHGVPLTRRDSYGPVMPDKITIFQRPLENICDSEDELVEEVRLTVAHEIAHFFGIDDDRLDELGL
jgi:predicted Zn-dependent protease with MMP-like domain